MRLKLETRDLVSALQPSPGEKVHFHPALLYSKEEAERTGIRKQFRVLRQMKDCLDLD